MDGFAGYRQLLTPSMAPIEDLADGLLAVELMRLMNDGLADLVDRHCDRFPTFAAALSLHGVDSAIAEIRETIKALDALDLASAVRRRIDIENISAIIRRH